jgi:uncharacterized domain HDIG
MNKEMFLEIEKYMLTCMNDGAHDRQHIYRVLYTALNLAEGHVVNIDVLIAAAMLHDIGRDAQFKNQECDHAIVGSEMACRYLSGIGWDAKRASHVRACIETHRYRSSNPPISFEAKILFDADKLDATGTMGIARTLMYNGIVSRPLYSVDGEGNVSSGVTGNEPSFFHEYNWKLKNIYDKFYTDKAKGIAEGRRKACIDFYESMYNEVDVIHKKGVSILKDIIV